MGVRDGFWASRRTARGSGFLRLHEMARRSGRKNPADSGPAPRAFRLMPDPHLRGLRYPRLTDRRPRLGHAFGRALAKAQVSPMPPRRMVLTQWRKIAAALLPCVFAAGVLHAQGIATSNGCALPAPLSGYKFVLEKQSSGYAWERVEQRFTNVGDHAALVHVRAVSLDRGDLDVLSASAGRDLSGMIPLSDGAGDVVAVGRQVRGLRVGDRVVSTYFRNWTDAWASAEQLRDARGASVAGVFAD
jgi:hypothetical protein